MTPLVLTDDERLSWGWPVSRLTAGSRFLWDVLRCRPVDMCCGTITPATTEALTVVASVKYGPVYHISVTNGRTLEVIRDAGITLIETINQ